MVVENCTNNKIGKRIPNIQENSGDPPSIRLNGQFEGMGHDLPKTRRSVGLDHGRNNRVNTQGGFAMKNWIIDRYEGIVLVFYVMSIAGFVFVGFLLGRGIGIAFDNSAAGFGGACLGFGIGFFVSTLAVGHALTVLETRDLLKEQTNLMKDGNADAYRLHALMTEIRDLLSDVGKNGASDGEPSENRRPTPGKPLSKRPTGRTLGKGLTFRVVNTLNNVKSKRTFHPEDDEEAKLFAEKKAAALKKLKARHPSLKFLELVQE